MSRGEDALPRYRQLLDKVDAAFESVRRRNADRFACARGCHACCLPGLSVFRVERDHIRSWLGERPEARARLESLAREDPHDGQRCALLDRDGACTIYPVRPVVCRSQGAPLRLPDDESVDVCPLNFEDVDLASLDGADVLDLETLNTILVAVNGLHEAEADTSSGRRFPLTLAGLFSDES